MMPSAVARPVFPLSRFLRLVLVALLVAGSVHFYFWLRLVHDTALPEPWAALASVLLVGLALSMPLSFLIRRRRPGIVWPAQIWMGVLLLLFTALLAADLLRAVLGIAGHSLGPRVMEGSAAGLALTLAGFGLVHARRLVVQEVEVTLARLPRTLDGFVIAQISDLHIGATLGRELVEEVVARTNAQKPDLIVITGDLADGNAQKLRAAAEPLGRLAAPHGVYFVTGNHEYFGDLEGWLTLLRSLGVRVLRNERVPIDRGGDGFDLAGIDDPMGHFTPGHGPDLVRALSGRDPSRETVLLSHRPGAALEASRHGVGLVLSGHTHAGQVWPFRYLVRLAEPFVVGLHRIGGTSLYVSAGTGWWGPPMRLGTTREVTRIVLRAP